MACMNSSCGVSSSSIEWKKGWPLRSGGFANLCDKCGSAYEQSIFCEVFHLTESGWRDCISCGKRLHCGCVVSKFHLELLDGGGVKCVGCAKSFGIHMIATDDKLNGLSTSKHQFNGINVDKMKLVQLSNHPEGIGFRHLLQPQNDNTNGLFQKMKQEHVPPPSLAEIGSQYFSNLNQGSNGATEATKSEFRKANLVGSNDIYDALPHTNLTMTLGSSLGHSNNPFPGAMIDDREHGKPSSMFSQQGSRSRHVLPKPSRLAETSTSMASQVRVARPPAEGRGRNQLLPRYWPRITDQELQQISGDSNSTIVPLFEKMLSASDAGRIGRLVLPKACAEAYFPPISQPEGLALKIQDVKGKEWVFQFRFWPNNNSRMYVLEGVTPCIQSMQLQAGDTVTFSRMDPEGKLIMGFRKASTSAVMQETHPSANHNGAQSSENFFSGVFENLPIISGYSGLLQSLKGNTDTHLNSLSKHLSSTSADINWQKFDKNEGKTKEGFVMSSMLIPERKRTRNIGAKIKRLHMDNQDVLELRISWEDAQDLLRPPPAIRPSTVVIEDIEFEEYEEPPVFGKTSVFIVRFNGEHEQWAQCDSCSKWRRIPNEVLLPSKWTCADNAWDQSRCSCSVPDELTPQEQESLVRQNKEFKRQRTMQSNHNPPPENEPSGLDALANAAALGDPGIATTTKHPRHRPGCSCIVCIQPPSGKGKHKPTCTCNVCMTVKRRFKTLMMNKKKRQSEREAEIVAAGRAQKLPVPEPEPAPVPVPSRLANESESVAIALANNNNNNNNNNASKEAGLDLNCDPVGRVSMMGLLHVANRPLEAYLKQNGLTSLAQPEQQQTTSSPSLVQAQVTSESEKQLNDENFPGSSAQEHESVVGQEQSQNDPPQS